MIQLASVKHKYNSRGRRRMQREPVMPRTFGDQIPQRRYSQQPQQYGNREQLAQQHAQAQQQAQAQAQAQAQQALQQQQQQQRAAAEQNQQNQGIRPPPVNTAQQQQASTTTYAYPGMISAADLSQSQSQG